MQRNNAYLVLLAVIVALQGVLIASLIRSMPSRQAQAIEGTAATVKPSIVTPIPGTSLKRVVLTPRAAERTGVVTDTIKQQQVSRSVVVAGEMVSGAGEGVKLPVADKGDGLLVRVPYSGDTARYDQTRPARIFRLGKDTLLMGTPIAAASVKTDATASEKGHFYRIEGAASGVAAGERVRVEIPHAGNDGMRLVVAHSAIIYDAKGAAWVYANPSALTYQREPVDIDYIEGDLAVLKSGPASGTTVVTVGAILLWGTELGK